MSRLPGSRGPPVNAISVNMAVYPRRSLPPRSAVDKRPRRPITQRGFANAMGLPRLVVRRRRRDELSLKVSLTRLPGQKKSIYSYQLRRKRATARSVMCVCSAQWKYQRKSSSSRSRTRRQCPPSHWRARKRRGRNSQQRAGEENRERKQPQCSIPFHSTLVAP